MTPPRPRTSRKILVASMGVATMTYVISCGGGTTTSGDGGPDATTDSIDEHPVANLVGHPVDASDHATVDEFPVANLVVSPDH